MQQLLVCKFSYKPKVCKIDPQKFWRINLRNSTVTEKVVNISSIQMLIYCIIYINILLEK